MVHPASTPSAFTLNATDLGHATRIQRALIQDLGGADDLSTAQEILAEFAALTARLAQVAAARNNWKLCLQSIAQARGCLLALGLERRARLIKGQIYDPAVVVWQAASKQHTLPPDRDPEQPEDEPGDAPQLVEDPAHETAAALAAAARELSPVGPAQTRQTGDE